MVAAQQEEVFGVLDLVGEQQADGFDGVLAAVHVVAQEEVVGVGREAAQVEQSQQVVELPVDVADLPNKAYHFDGRLELQHDGLGHEDLDALGQQVLDLGLGQVDALLHLESAHGQQLLDHLVHLAVPLLLVHLINPIKLLELK